MAQAFQSTAHGRLTKSDPSGRSGDMALAEQCIQHHQKIQIDTSQIHTGTVTIYLVNFSITNIHWMDFCGFAKLPAQILPGIPMTSLSISQNSVTNRQRRLAMLALMSAVVMATLDTTIATTALPRIALDLETTEASVIWIASAYQIAMIAALLPFASLGESVGYRRVYILGLGLFTLASLVCGLADSFPWLVVGRVLQGVGAAAIMSVNTAIIRYIYPVARLGTGLGLNALVVAVSFTLGPLVASALLTVGSWHLLFLFNIPVGAAALALSMRFLPHVVGARLAFDLRATVFCTGFLGLLGFGLCAFENQTQAMTAILSLGACVACLLALLKIQARHPAPMLAVDLLRVPIIALSSLTSICAFATQALAFVSLPFFFQHTLEMSIVSTGLLLTPWPATVATMALVSSLLSDRLSSGVLCTTGLLILGMGMLSLATLAVDADRASIVWRLVVCGTGFGLFQAPNMKAIMSNAPTHRSGGASGLVAISRLLGQTCGAALVAQCFYLWHQQGAQIALWLGCVTAGLGAVFSAMRLAPGTAQYVG